jgi:hypothetical protein
LGGLLRGAHLTLEENFDDFLCRHIPKAAPVFMIAPIHSSLNFSWEVNPRICQKLNGGRLPFGAHAWARYDRPFFEKLLEV